MYIKSGKQGVIEINADNASAALITKPMKIESEEAFQVILGPVEDKRVIYSPGEFEHQDISVVAQESTETHDGIADIFHISADQVEILFITALPTDLDKEAFDSLTSVGVDIVLLAEDAISEEVAKFIKKVDPYIVIANSSDKAVVEKALGMEVVQTEKKFKFTEKDFTAEEPATILHLLAA